MHQNNMTLAQLQERRVSNISDRVRFDGIRQHLIPHNPNWEGFFYPMGGEINTIVIADGKYFSCGELFRDLVDAEQFLLDHWVNCVCENV